MRTIVWTIVTMVFAAAPARAQLTTFYKGVQREGGKAYPATAQFSVEAGRAAMIMTGARSARMLFLEKDQVLRIVSDDDKSYFDLGKSGVQGTTASVSSAMADAQKQLEQMPPEQRKMAAAMLEKAMGNPRQAPQVEYLRTEDRRKISGYDCLRVESRRDGQKVSEYWGTTSDDFKMSQAERKTMLAMQDYLRNLTISVRSDKGGESRAFQWDTSIEGYPIVTRCFRDTVTTLDLKLESFNRKPLPKDLFAVPAAYKKMEIPRLPK